MGTQQSSATEGEGGEEEELLNKACAIHNIWQTNNIVRHI